MRVTRRTFLKIAGATGTAAVVGQPRETRAAPPRRGADETLAMMFDATQCVGCRACEAACSEANRLPEPVMQGDASVFARKRTMDSRTYTVVNRYPNGKVGGSATFVKTQCMHCVQPACASACLVKALEKTPEGPVVYHTDRCIGCRYCMVACPFGVPKFEYEKALPYIQKCSFCIHRLNEGKLPACSQVCPSGALQFGKRKDLLEMAKSRIYRNPDRYVHHIYGEHEVGGTGWLCLSHIPFEQVGFRGDLGTRPYPEFTWPFLSAVPFVLMLWPPFLMGLYAFRKGREETARTGAGGAAVEGRHE
jgi:Fe-S-cluster-containing dehydrogenase component